MSMGREEFLDRLQNLLTDLPEEEQEAALEYYGDYLEEAGADHEQETIAALGSPEKVAARIRAGFQGEAETGEFTENGYRDTWFDEEPQAPDQYGGIVVSRRRKRQGARSGSREEASGRQSERDGSWTEAGKRQSDQSGDWEDESSRKDGAQRHTRFGADVDASEQEDGRWSEKKDRRQGIIFLLILLVAFGLPTAGSIIGAGFSIIGGFFGLVIGVFGGLFGLIVAGFTSSVALFGSGIALIVSGGRCLTSMTAIGLMLIGWGFLAGAVGILLWIASLWGCRRAVPSAIRVTGLIIRKGIDCCKRLAHRVFGGGAVR